jgi:hypothetical protein
VIYEQEEPWWNDDVDRRKLPLVHQSFLAILPAESSDSKQEEWVKGIRIWS